MKKQAIKLWSALPKEFKVAGYIGLSAGIWAFIKQLGVEFEGDALAIAVINLLAVAVQRVFPSKR